MSSTTENLEIMKQLGENIAKYRKKRGLTQQELGEVVNHGRRTIQAIEKGERWPRPATLLNISKALNAPIEKLFQGIG